MLLLGLLVACAPPPLDTAAPAEDQTPTIEILFPDPALRPYCDAFMVVVNIDHLVLNDGFYEEELPLVDGEGHWHLILPNSQVSALGVPYGSVDGDFTPGTYSFTAQLVDNNHAPLVDAAVDVVEIFIDGDDPACIGGAGAAMDYDDTGSSG